MTETNKKPSTEVRRGRKEPDPRAKLGTAGSEEPSADKTPVSAPGRKGIGCAVAMVWWCIRKNDSKDRVSKKENQ